MLLWIHPEKTKTPEHYYSDFEWHLAISLTHCNNLTCSIPCSTLLVNGFELPSSVMGKCVNAHE